jgi:hypothetical protein
MFGFEINNFRRSDPTLVVLMHVKSVDCAQTSNGIWSDGLNGAQRLNGWNSLNASASVLERAVFRLTS